MIGSQYSLENLMADAHQYSRNGIEAYIDEFLKDTSAEQRDKFKDQLLGIWDRAIHYWMDSRKNSTSIALQPAALTDSLGELVQNAGEFLSIMIIIILILTKCCSSCIMFHFMLSNRAVDGGTAGFN